MDELVWTEHHLGVDYDVYETGVGGRYYIKYLKHGNQAGAGFYDSLEDAKKKIVELVEGPKW